MPVHLEATVCATCGRSVGSTRRWAIWSGILAVLVALATIGSFLVPWIVSLMHDPTSKGRLSQPVFGESEVALVASNIGDEASMIEEVALESHDVVPFYARLSSVSERLIPQGAKQIVVEMRAYPRDDDPTKPVQGYIPRRKRAEEAGHLIFKIRQSNGALSTVAVPINRERMAAIVNVTIWECARPETHLNCKERAALLAQNVDSQSDWLEDVDPRGAAASNKVFHAGYAMGKRSLKP